MNYIKTKNFIVEDLGIQEIDVYDIEVEDNHNFFANDILVHNSTYLGLSKLVELAYPNKSIDATVKFLDKVCEDKITPIINTACTEIQNYTNAFRHNIIFKREAIANKAVIVAKKKYAMNVYNNEGVQYTEPELKIMGLQMIQSSTPPKIAKKMKSALSVIMEGSQSNLQEYVAGFRDEFNSLPVDDISKVTGVNNLEKYTGSPIYSKGTPMNVRAALLFNHYISKHNLTDKYEKIKEGEKIKMVYLKMPNPIQENIIGFTSELPKEFGVDNYIDYDVQFEKVFTDAIDTIISPMGWNVVHQASIEDFFS